MNLANERVSIDKDIFSFEDHKFVFVCGLHRSGTSLLFKCLREHPQTSGFLNTGAPEDEGQHLQTICKPASAYGGWGKFGFNSKAYLNEFSSLVTQKNRNSLFTQWSKHWALEKQILLEKSPPNLVRTRFLQAMFPNSFFIILTRHPIAVSYATKRVSKTSIYSLVHHWVTCHKMAKNDSEYLKNCITIRYEDFVENPEKILGELFCFLGTKNHKSEESISSNVNEKYFHEWEKVRRNILLRPYTNQIVKRFNTEIKSFNYDIENIN